MIVKLLSTLSFISFFVAFPVTANLPLVRYKNATVGIVTDSSGDVMVEGKKISVKGSITLLKGGQSLNVTRAMISLREKENDLSARVSKLAEEGNFNMICHPFNTQYVEKNSTSGEFGECVCKEGYSAGNACR